MLTDQPLGLYLWNNSTIRRQDGFKEKCNPIVKGLVPYISDAVKAIHVLNNAAGSVGEYDIW